MVKTFGAEAGRSQTCDVVDLSIRARDGMNIIMTLLTVPLISEPLRGRHVTFASKTYPYLAKLDLADLGESSSCMDVGILIRADNYWSWSLVTGRTQRGRRTQRGSGPTAIETRLGWVLSRPATGMTSESASVNLLSCHVLKTGVDNPADLPSRESDLDELIGNQLWLHGPKWLLNSTGMGDLSSIMEDSVLKEGMYELKVKDWA